MVIVDILVTLGCVWAKCKIWKAVLNCIVQSPGKRPPIPPTANPIKSGSLAAFSCELDNNLLLHLAVCGSCRGLILSCVSGKMQISKAVLIALKALMRYRRRYISPQWLALYGQPKKGSPVGTKMGRSPGRMHTSLCYRYSNAQSEYQRGHSCPLASHLSSSWNKWVLTQLWRVNICGQHTHKVFSLQPIATQKHSSFAPAGLHVHTHSSPRLFLHLLSPLRFLCLLKSTASTCPLKDVAANLHLLNDFYTKVNLLLYQRTSRMCIWRVISSYQTDTGTNQWTSSLWPFWCLNVTVTVTSKWNVLTPTSARALSVNVYF